MGMALNGWLYTAAMAESTFAPSSQRFQWKLVLAGLLVTLATTGSCDRKRPQIETDSANRSAGQNSGRVMATDGGSQASQSKPHPAGKRSWLVVVAHEHESATARYLPLRIVDPAARGSDLRAGTPIEHAAIELANWPGHYNSQAAQDSNGAILVVGHPGAKSGGTGNQTSSPAWQVTRHDLAAGSQRDIAIDAEPTALHLHGEQLYVGAGHRVGHVDLRASQPRFTVIHERPDLRYKAFDLFVRHDDWLIAIDDEVFPLYADSFELADGKPPVHRGGWDLPSVINGHYDMAALLPGQNTGNGTIFLVASYGILSGDGYDLIGLPVRDHKLIAPDDFVLQNREASQPAVLEEHNGRGGSQPDKLLAGTNFTPWSGLALVRSGASAMLAIAVGQRGIFLVPGDFTMSSKVTQVDTGGQCFDVLADGSDTLHALVKKNGASTTTVVTMQFTPSTLTVVSEHSLPAMYHRFVR